MDLDGEELKATREMKAINNIIANGNDTNVDIIKTADEMFEKIGFKRQKYSLGDNNLIIYENEKKSRFFIFNKRQKAIECTTEHGFSNFIYPHEFEAIINFEKELGWIYG